MKERITYAVFYKMAATDYEPRPAWRQYGEWAESLEYTMLQLRSVQRNPRFAEVKIVKRIETFEDLPEREETP